MIDKGEYVNKDDLLTIDDYTYIIGVVMMGIELSDILLLDMGRMPYRGTIEGYLGRLLAIIVN